MLTQPFSDPNDDPNYLPDPSDLVPRASPSAGKNSAAEQGLNVPMAWKPSVSEPVPVVRCTATRRNGERCGRWSVRGTTVCMAHGAQLPNVREHANAVVEAARMRLVGMTDEAIDALEDLVQIGTSDQIRLKAAEAILDRSGIKGAPDLTVVVEQRVSAAEEISKRLAAIASRIQADKAEEPEDLGEVEEPSE